MALKLETAAEVLAELGNPTRLGIIRLLVRAGDEGLPVGALQRDLKTPASTLSHHLKHLLHVGLIHQQRQGAALICSVNYDLVDEVVSFLTAECCVGNSVDGEQHPSQAA